MKTIEFLFTVILVFIFTGISAQEGKVLKPNADGVYYEAEVMPEFPGGFTALQEFLVKNIQYPEDAKKTGITGKVFVQFVIDQAGKVTGPKVLKAVHPLLDAEAVRVIGTMPDWTPGTVKGEKVKVAFTLPIAFALK